MAFCLFLRYMYMCVFTYIYVYSALHLLVT
jgi:hypothetical protein